MSEWINLWTPDKGPGDWEAGACALAVLVGAAPLAAALAAWLVGSR